MSTKNGRSEYWFTAVIELPDSSLSCEQVFNILSASGAKADEAAPGILSRILVVSNADRLEGYSPVAPNLTEEVREQFLPKTNETVQ